MKTLYFTYGVKPDVLDHYSTLMAGQQKLERRGLICKVNTQKRMLIASYKHEDWQNSHSFPINSFWDVTLEGLRFVNIKVLFTDTVIPSPKKSLGGYEWMNGERYYWPRTTLDGSIKVTITCLPTPETVELSMDIEDKFDTHQYRVGFIETLQAIENMIVQTKTALDLIKALRVQPVNKGYASRAINKHLLALARP